MAAAAPPLDDTRAATSLASSSSKATIDKPVSVLSGRRKTRLALTTLVVSGANVLLSSLNPAPSNLDPASREEILAALRDYEETVILVRVPVPSPPSIRSASLLLPTPTRTSGTTATSTGDAADLIASRRVPLTARDPLSQHPPCPKSAGRDWNEPAPASSNNSKLAEELLGAILLQYRSRRRSTRLDDSPS